MSPTKTGTATITMVVVFAATAASQLPCILPPLMTVNAQANIFGAGFSTLPAPGGGPAGVAPVLIALPGSPSGDVVRFNAAGLTNCCSGTPNVSPDGGVGNTDITSYNGISGIIHNQAEMFLVGVFLDASQPANPAPARLNFSNSGTQFQSLAPLLNQVFFIGDGLTGTGTGLLQEFNAPPGATRLFLGIADAWAFQGAPGWYGDNTGQYQVTVFINCLPPQPASVVTVGTGCIGSLAVAPSLGASQVPSLGNLGFSVSIAQGVPGSTAWLFAAAGTAAVPWSAGGICTIYLDSVTLALFLSAGLGPVIQPLSAVGNITYALPIPPTWGPNTVFALQAAVVEPTSWPLGFSVTNALLLTVN